ncbi:MAG: HD domain-containing protein [Proteobacteria bacterium]|nr:HD domain-containing protein [Pseudomonadota bacterium]
MTATTVSFTQMQHGSKEDYLLLQQLEDEYCKGLSDRLLAALQALEHTLSGYQVSRLEHSLQSATRAHAAGESEELIVAALLHDIGDELAPHSHSELAAAVLRPYVSEKTYWLIKYHGVFQMYYYAHHVGGDRNARDRFRGHPWFDDAVRFCEEYDQNCFDPTYVSKPLEFFEPMLRTVFSRTPFSLGQLVE